MCKLYHIITEYRLPAARIVFVNISCAVHFKRNDDRIAVLYSFLVFRCLVILIAVAYSADIFGYSAVLFQPCKRKLHCVLYIIIRVEISCLAVCTKVKRQKVVIVFNECHSLFSDLKCCFSVLVTANYLQCFFSICGSKVKYASLLFQGKYPCYCIVDSFLFDSTVCYLFGDRLDIFLKLGDAFFSIDSHRLKYNINACIYCKHSGIYRVKVRRYRIHYH